MKDKLFEKRTYRLIKRESAGQYIRSVYATDITPDKAKELGIEDMNILLEYFIWDFIDCIRNADVWDDRERAYWELSSVLGSCSYITLEEETDWGWGRKEKVFAVSIDEAKEYPIVQRLPPRAEGLGDIPKISKRDN